LTRLRRHCLKHDDHDTRDPRAHGNLRQD